MNFFQRNSVDGKIKVLMWNEHTPSGHNQVVYMCITPICLRPLFLHDKWSRVYVLLLEYV